MVVETVKSNDAMMQSMMDEITNFTNTTPNQSNTNFVLSDCRNSKRGIFLDSTLRYWVQAIPGYFRPNNPRGRHQYTTVL